MADASLKHKGDLIKVRSPLFAMKKIRLTIKRLSVTIYIKIRLKRGKTMGEQSLYEKVINEFKNKLSVIEISKKLQISIVKVRRILITEGLWRSRTSDEIGRLHNQHYSVKEIAEALHMTEKNVQAYLPYSKGLYGLENKSDSAAWSDDFRKRKKRAADAQVVPSITENENVKRQEMLDMEKEWITSNPPIAVKLHLELDIDNFSQRNIPTLKKYAKVKNTISRDILVPGDITLDALHYVIQRLFGWQNSHLHHFYLPDDEFEKVTQNKVKEWQKLCGIYFRFPDSDMEDRYWGSNYDPEIAFNSWLKKKYQGPYVYAGLGDYYYENQDKVQELKLNMREFEVRQFFNSISEKGQNGRKVIELENATIEELEGSIAFEQPINCLLERLFVIDYLFMPNKEYDVIDEEARSIIDGLNDDIELSIRRWKRIINNLPKGRMDFELAVGGSTLRMKPITGEIRYCYDPGDNWNVSITCPEVYYNKHYSPFAEKEAPVYVDSQMKELDNETLKDINRVIMRHSPICINSDGMNVFDDVGGIDGFAEFLRTIHESDDENERKERREWARYLGWTGRDTKPQNRL